jgi:recombination protein RecT
MTGQTVSAAVAVRSKDDQLVEWIRSQQDEIAMAAASHVRPAAIIRVAHGALRRNEKLMAAAIANPQSLLYALLDCARLGHEPDTDDYYLGFFGNEVTGLEGYKGIIERMYRAGGVSSVVAEVVRQGDVYRRTGPTTPPVHEFDEFADPEGRGPLRGAYAYAVMLDGRFSKVIAMGQAEIMRHKAKSRGSDKDDSPWIQWPESMWKKCPLRGLEPYVPTSTEYRGSRGTSPAVRESADSRTWQAQPRPATPGAGVVLQAVPEPAAPPSRPARPAPRTDGPARQQAARGPARPTEAALAKLDELLREVPLGKPEDVAAWRTWITGHPAAEDATAADVAAATRNLTAALKAADENGVQAAHNIWLAYRKANPEQAEDSGQPEGGGS